MASLRQIRRRMKSIDSIHEITKAMEMISTFRLKKAETRFTKAKNYFSEMERLMANLCAAREEIRHPLFREGKVKKKTLLVITADRGLCGSYNTNLVRATGAWVANNAAFGPELVSVGRVGGRVFKKRLFPVLSEYPDKGSADAALAAKIAAELKDRFLDGRTDLVEILYAGYQGGLARERVVPFLGLTWLLKDKKASPQADYIYEPDFDGVFSALLDCYLKAKVNTVIAESIASEQAARRMAMKQATENGEEILDSLTLLRNKTRQAAITRELSEIVSGAEGVS